MRKIRTVRKPKIRKSFNRTHNKNTYFQEFGDRYLRMFDKISTDPRSPSFLLCGHYIHYQIEPNMFIAVCFQNTPTDIETYILNTYMTALSLKYYNSDSYEERRSTFYDIIDVLMSIDGISGLVNTIFNMENDKEILLSFSDKSKYLEEITVH